MQELIAKRRQQVLHDEKWQKFLNRARLFRFIPFVDLALAAGSMAVGNVGPQSDFDVIVGARLGRIFTARFFAVLAFGIFGWRRKKLSHKEAAADKICLNHFVTERAYRLSGPHDAYWKKLYQNIVPLFGSVETVNKFFSANNDWVGVPVSFVDDLRHNRSRRAFLRIFLEKLLSGQMGILLEKVLRKIQIERIERGLKNDPPGYKPRIIYGDDELEFHPDTRRIEKLNETL
ncbi:MAG: hypothetical protein Q7S83_02930 [bacterium]|nr:hypothetical protein [bacterium]